MRRNLIRIVRGPKRRQVRRPAFGLSDRLSWPPEPTEALCASKWRLLLRPVFVRIPNSAGRRVRIPWFTGTDDLVLESTVFPPDQFCRSGHFLVANRAS